MCLCVHFPKFYCTGRWIFVLKEIILMLDYAIAIKFFFGYKFNLSLVFYRFVDFLLVFFFIQGLERLKSKKKNISLLLFQLKETLNNKTYIKISFQGNIVCKISGKNLQ